MLLQEHRRRVAIAPNDAEARFALGEALAEAGSSTEAAEQLERALALDPTHRGARRALLRVLLGDGRRARAAQLLADLLEAAPEDALLRDDVAEVHLREQRRDDALFHLVLGDRHGAPDPQRKRRIVELSLQLGHLARAQAALAGYEASQGQDEFGREARAELASQTGRPAIEPPRLDAEFVWGRLRGRASRLRSEGPFAALLSRVASGDPAQLKRALVLLPETDRRAPLAQWLRATLAICAGDREGAERGLSVVIDAPDRTLRRLALGDRGELRAARGDLIGAHADYASAAGEAPDDLDLGEALGDALFRLDRLDEARAAYERVTRENPGGAAAQKLALLRVRAVQAEDAARYGAMNALAWTAYGGAITPVQAAYVAGRGELVLTGRVKKTGAEQAKVVHSVLRKRGEPPEGTAQDLHLHYEDTENEKDGPSAGVALALAALSASLRRPLRAELAATGELTLAGHVRPVGGLHEKLVAAFLRGMKRVIVPLKNLSDLDELPRELRAAIEIIPVSALDEAVAFAFEDEPKPAKGAR